MRRAVIRWAETLSVGVPIIDADHKRLLGLVAEVIQAYNSGLDHATLLRLADALIEYTRHHFSREESFLEEVSYSQLAEHRKEHAALAADLDEVRQRMETAEGAVPVADVLFLQTWLLDHIICSDLAYASVFRAATIPGLRIDGGGDTVRPRAVSAGKREPVPDKRILLVEDSKFFQGIIRREIQQTLDITVDIADSMAAAGQLLSAHSDDYFLAILDMILPDSADGEVAELCGRHNVPVVVFSSIYSDDLRERLMASRMIDYIIKDNLASVAQLVALVRRLCRNRSVKALVVDDSAAARAYVGDLLTQYCCRTMLAKNGTDALRILKDNPDIRLIVTDYFMPDMDGIEMIKRMRVSHPRDRLAIIGLSSGAGSSLSARFIKNGANDFLAKPFLREEFFYRISQNMDGLDAYDTIRELSYRDYLTGLHNRRYFFEVGETLVASMLRGQLTMALAVIDLDHFKSINDTHGHEAGDAVLKAVTKTLIEATRASDVVARAGGEEFYLLAVNLTPEEAPGFFERLRAVIAAIRVPSEQGTVQVTASIGVNLSGRNSLKAMLSAADAMMYRAKQGGRDRVEIDSGE